MKKLVFLIASIATAIQFPHNATACKFVVALAKTNDVEQMKSLLKCPNIDVNEIDERFFFRTALHFAAERKYLAIVKLLLDHGAQVNIADQHGCTPLHLAVQTKWTADYPIIGEMNAPCPEIVELLLAHQARINVRKRPAFSFYPHIPTRNFTEYGYTPLQCAYASLLQAQAMQSHDEVAAFSRIIELIVQHIKHEENICPVCLESAAEIGAENYSATPCCHNFICANDLAIVKAIGQTCPLCRSWEGWR